MQSKTYTILYIYRINDILFSQFTLVHFYQLQSYLNIINPKFKTYRA